MPTKDPVLAARAKLGVASRRKDAAMLHEARLDMNEAKVERAIRESLATTPALTDERRQRLAALLLGGGAK